MKANHKTALSLAAIAVIAAILGVGDLQDRLSEQRANEATSNFTDLSREDAIAFMENSLDPCHQKSLSNSEIERCNDIKQSETKIWKEINEGNRSTSLERHSALRVCQARRPANTTELKRCYARACKKKIDMKIKFYCTDLNDLYDNFSMEACRTDREKAWAE